jgi:signal peptidase I
MDEITTLWIETLKKNGSAFLRVKGKSMEPFLEMGERILVSDVAPQSINIGDVVVFNCRGGLQSTGVEIIVHRIVDKFRFSDKLYFVHRGDNARLLGMSIFAEDQLLGRIENGGFRRIKARMQTDILARKFFIYFFILKQLLKKTLQIQTDRGTDANG